MSPTYVRGYTTAVPGYASSITYHPSNLVDTITHTNGVTVTHGVDPDGMARPASIQATKGGVVRWDTGTYQYDGSGNVAKIGDAYFLYDGVQRLVTGAVSVNQLGVGGLLERDYRYDAFGNLQEIIGSPGRATPTDSATNRLSGSASYDTAGNLTSWNGNVYEYDAFNMMSRMTAGARGLAVRVHGRRRADLAGQPAVFAAVSSIYASGISRIACCGNTGGQETTGRWWRTTSTGTGRCWRRRRRMGCGIFIWITWGRLG